MRFRGRGVVRFRRIAPHGAVAKWAEHPIVGPPAQRHDDAPDKTCPNGWIDADPSARACSTPTATTTRPHAATARLFRPFVASAERR